MARRDRPDDIPDKDECIRIVMRRMQVPGVWVTGKTCHDLAQEWGISVKTVEGYSAEASRRLRDAQFDRAATKTMLVEHLKFIAGQAIVGGKGGRRELRTAVAAYAELAAILGLHGAGGDMDDRRPDEIVFRRYVPTADDDETPDV